MRWPALSQIIPFRLSKVEDYLIQLVFPQYCELCDKSMVQLGALCHECAQTLPKIKGPQCKVCSLELLEESWSGKCTDCSQRSWFFHHVIANYRFSDDIQKLIYTFKYKKGSYLAQNLAQILAEALMSDERTSPIDPEEWMLTAVPLHFLRYRQRTFNQAELLAKGVAQITNIPYIQTLSRQRYTTQQVRLSRKARQRNIRGAFEPNGKPLLRKNVLLVDDVYTSGATVNECARVLKTLGAEKVVILCLARGV